jgi:histidine triad (HIT) family protein
MDNCIFCKIVKNEMSAYTIYEDDKVKAMLDVYPSSVGHVLVIPKIHAKNIYELEEELGGHLFKVVMRISKAIKKAYNMEGLNILQNNGECANQTVMHFHMHIIPRTIDDEIKLGWESLKLENNDFEKIVEKIKINII